MEFYAWKIQKNFIGKCHTIVINELTSVEMLNHEKKENKQ